MCVVQWDGLWKWRSEFEILEGGREGGAGRGGKWGGEGVVCCELGVPTAANFG
jgi:hypothetical protein